MTDTQLMQSIHTKFGSYIAAAVHASSLPAEFVAALIANESGGNPAASRFELDQFESLTLVLVGRKAAFHPTAIKKPLGPADILPYLDPGVAINDAGKNVSFQLALGRLADLATSWGLTQIMGWHAVEFSTVYGRGSSIAEQLDFTVRLAAYFAEKYQLDLRSDFSALFACWNTGETDPTKTYDPHYVANGLARMKLYVDMAGSDAT